MVMMLMGAEDGQSDGTDHPPASWQPLRLETPPPVWRWRALIAAHPQQLNHPPLACLGTPNPTARRSQQQAESLEELRGNLREAELKIDSLAAKSAQQERFNTSQLNHHPPLVLGRQTQPPGGRSRAGGGWLVFRVLRGAGPGLQLKWSGTAPHHLQPPSLG